MKLKKIFLLLLVVTFLGQFQVSLAQAEAPYPEYNYSYWGKTVPSPVAYLPSRIIDGKSLGIGDFKNPEDIYTASDGRIYLLDSGNGRIVILDQNWRLIKEIVDFKKEGQVERLNNPQGITVADNGDIYVADTDNRRVIELTNDGQYVREITTPENDVIREGFPFFPRKVALDKANRIYVIGKDVFDGLIAFSPEGKFENFMGTNRVRFNPADYFWKSVSTKAQREKMALFVPTEFTNMDMDQDGFIYATNADANSRTPIKRLNPTGVDVLRREGYDNPRGDLEFAFTGNKKGPSIMTDIKVGFHGMYHALDSNRGRIFTYDEDGKLLYITGQIGVQRGTFKIPTAIEISGDRLMVLDKGANQLTVFEPTQFGRTVNEAVKLHSEGDEIASAEQWRQVLRLNANYEIAYIGIGKALLRQEKNKEAMEYFKLGMSRKYYSKAFQRYRKEVMKEQFGTGMTVLVLITAGFFVYKFIIRSARRRREGMHAERGH
ncbi:gluconolactonase [Paenibacillus sp. MY03]|jgi:hypothetical protein|uniref:NHL repeat-containing protein n=1 Tax=Paenibacillus sp. MY03 TaxID=302980 RepID=UPI000B3D30F1|nr:NHL repeat-containing protein [Paenibacillus sp. MY03]OUS78114.1 gluconolactonase [Paenibacillus sp. MY03]